MSHQDDVFMRVFGAVLAFLIIFAFVVYFIAQAVSEKTGSGSAMSEKAVQERIKPVGQVATGTAAGVAASAAQATTMAAAPEAASTGADVPAACMACHGVGVLGAPKVGSKEQWEPRLALGMDTLIASVANGKGNMPPQGSLFDEAAIKSAIEAMLEKSGL